MGGRPRERPVIPFPPIVPKQVEIIRPDMTKIRKVLDTIPQDDAGQLYLTALVGVLEAEKAKQRRDCQAMVTGLGLAFFAIAGILGIPRDEAEDYLPDAS